MPAKFICPMSKEELYKAYIIENRTLPEMCELIGVKNSITARRILREKGIETNSNVRKKQKTLNGMSDAEFEKFLRKEYAEGKSMGEIGKIVGITPSGVRKYFLKYGIQRRKNTDFLTCAQKNPKWKGERLIRSNGYVTIWCPDHPNAHKDGRIYEHQLVMEKHIGRYLRSDEVVHHIDGDKSNNDINNLMLLTNSEHAKLHAILKKAKNRVIKRG